MAVLHQDVALVGQLGFVPVALAVQTGFRIGRGGVGRGRAPLAVKVDGRIARIVRGRRRRVLAAEASGSRRKDTPAPPPDDPGNPTVDFWRAPHGCHPCLHYDPEARLARKSRGHEPRLA